MRCRFRRRLQILHCGSGNTAASVLGMTTPRMKRRPARPLLEQGGDEVQPYGVLVSLPIGLSPDICRRSVTALNQVLADTMSLRDLYKKHHWQVAGPTFYQ